MNNKNHIATNIITRGNLNISSITKGFILPFFTYEIKVRKGGGSGIYKGSGYYELERDLYEIRKKQEEIDAIVVYVDWYKKQSKINKNIYADIIRNKIEAELLERTKEKYEITVEFIKKDKINISAKLEN